MSFTLSTLVIAVFSLPVQPVPLQGPFLASVALEQQAQGAPLGTRTSSGVSSMRCQYEHELSGNGGARGTFIDLGLHLWASWMCGGSAGRCGPDSVMP